MAGTRLTLTFDEGLNESAPPSGGDFEVLVDGVAATFDGAPAVAGRRVVFPLAAPVYAPGIATVTYAGDTLEDTAILPNAVADFGPVTASQQAPLVVSTIVDGSALTITYDVGLDEASEPETDRFTASVAGDGERRVAGVT